MMDTADRELFERSLAAATEQHTSAALDAALDDLGWTDALADDPRTAVSLLFELQGSANATSSALDQVLAHALGIDLPTGVVLPAIGTTSPPGRIENSALQVIGLATAAIETIDHVSVATGSGVVPLRTSSLTLIPVAGVDPSLGLVTVTAADILIAGTPTSVGRWPDAVALGQIALGHELVGVSRAMLSLACTHALERIQFDRPIAQFQAVRHRLADTLVAIETADAALGAAWEDPSPTTAAMAKALAGRGARTAAHHCQQVLAGIGFTTEHDLHHYIRRALVLDELFGSARTLTRDLGQQVLATGQLPSPLPL